MFGVPFDALSLAKSWTMLFESGACRRVRVYTPSVTWGRNAEVQSTAQLAGTAARLDTARRVESARELATAT
jgi:hypothetical protein